MFYSCSYYYENWSLNILCKDCAQKNKKRNSRELLPKFWQNSASFASFSFRLNNLRQVRNKSFHVLFAVKRTRKKPVDICALV